MKSTGSLAVATLAWTLSGWALAQDGEETIVLVPEGVELPDVVTEAIDLPKNADGEYIASDKGVENSADGLATANAAREDGRAFGQEMAAAAQDNRESRSRGSRPDLSDLRPDRVPDDVSLPTLPEQPEPPVTPPVTPPARP
jgi:hypothetical protein